MNPGPLAKTAVVRWVWEGPVLPGASDSADHLDSESFVENVTNSTYRQYLVKEHQYINISVADYRTSHHPLSQAIFQGTKKPLQSKPCRGFTS